jgi:hypothetical protein
VLQNHRHLLRLFHIIPTVPVQPLLLVHHLSPGRRRREQYETNKTAMSSRAEPSRESTRLAAITRTHHILFVLLVRLLLLWLVASLGGSDSSETERQETK